VKSNKHRLMLSAAEMSVQVNDSSFWQYKSFLDIRMRFSDFCRHAGVGWLKSTSLQFPQCYIFVSFGNNADIVVHLWQQSVLDFCWHQ